MSTTKDHYNRICCLIFGTLLGVLNGGGVSSLTTPPAFAQLGDQTLPVTGKAVHFAHSVDPGRSLNVQTEGGPYVRVKVKLAEGVQAGEWEIETLNMNGDVVQRIPAGSLKYGIWTLQVWGSELTVRVPNNGGRVVIEKRLRLVTPLPVQDVIPRGSDPNFRPAISYPDPDIRKAASAVVHLRMMHGDEEKACTGLLISATLVMTNQHCVPTADIARQVTARIGYYSSMVPQDTLKVIDLVTSDYNLDYSVIRLAATPSRGVHFIPWRISGPVAQERITVVQHPGNQPMQVASDDDCYVSEARARGRDVHKLVDFGHRCDTLGGSSGSLILGVNDLRVVGIHHWGIGSGDKQEQNQGVRIDEIFRQLKQKATSDAGVREIYDAVMAVH